MIKHRSAASVLNLMKANRGVVNFDVLKVILLYNDMQN
jgi:hypothetical protein